MKKIIFAIFTLFAVNLSFSQEEDDSDVDYASGSYDILQVLYADEKYEKLLKVAEKFTFKEETKNDAEPYLWLAKGLFAMSKDETYTSQEKYKKAYNDALTWMGKYYKKPQNKELKETHQEFFVEIKQTVYDAIEADISSGNYAKAISGISKIAKVSPNNCAQDFLIGACNFQKGDKTTARENWKKAEAMLKKMTKEQFFELDKPEKMMLALGLVETGKCHEKAKKPELAKALLEPYADWFDSIELFTEYFATL